MKIHNILVLGLLRGSDILYWLKSFFKDKQGSWDLAESLPVTQAIKALGSEREYMNCKMLSLEKKAQGLNLGSKHSKEKRKENVVLCAT